MGGRDHHATWMSFSSDLFQVFTFSFTHHWEKAGTTRATSFLPPSIFHLCCLSFVPRASSNFHCFPTGWSVSPRTGFLLTGTKISSGVLSHPKTQNNIYIILHPIILSVYFCCLNPTRSVTTVWKKSPRHTWAKYISISAAGSQLDPILGTCLCVCGRLWDVCCLPPLPEAWFQKHHQTSLSANPGGTHRISRRTWHIPAQQSKLRQRLCSEEAGCVPMDCDREIFGREIYPAASQFDIFFLSPRQRNALPFPAGSLSVFLLGLEPAHAEPFTTLFYKGFSGREKSLPTTSFFWVSGTEITSLLRLACLSL